ncbi:MAG: hypothetical protein A3E82_03800 [Gammaproteobacteria bacterium RIFCSPHIGHO2_12_FULL_38_11]|nr:MAG: hypothetical protein A3E82_03800 [Gammaproteobacteria bacterium RIFCSPHIGHO2_12_FULL_38_11]
MRKKTENNFLKQFNCARLPAPTAFFKFLEKHELACFIKENSLIKQIFFKNTNTRIFCLPAGENIQNHFIETVSELISKRNENIILYFAWQLNSYHYVPLRLTLVFQEINAKNYIAVKTEVLNSEEPYCDVILTQPLINQLKKYLPDHEIFSLQDNIEERIQAETLYWSSLTLFLRLSQDSKKCHAQFLQWQQCRIFLLLDPLLNTASIVQSELFYAEQIIAVLKMPLAYKNTNNQFASILCCHLPLLRTVRTGVLAYLAYVAYQEENYFSLSGIPFALAFQLLTLCLTKKMPDGFLKNCSFYIFNFISIICRFIFNSYWAIPPLKIEREIVAPRFIFPLMEEITLFFIRIPAMFLFYFLMTVFMNQKTIENNDIQAGSLAMATLLVQAFILFITKYLFPFDGWMIPQKMEEKVLLSMHLDAALEIKSSFIARLFQQLFYNQQEIIVVLKKENEIKRCALTFSQNTDRSVSYTETCRSRFLKPYLKGDALTVTTQRVFEGEDITKQWRWFL